MFLASLSRSRLKKKTGAGAAPKKAGAGAAKIMLYICYSYLGKIVRFFCLNTIIYFFNIPCSFTLVVGGGEGNISPNLTNSQEPEPQGAACFCPLEAESA